MTAPNDPAAILATLVDMIAERVVAKLAMPANATGPEPVATVAARVGMSVRALRDLCKRHTIPIGGTRKCQFVDAAAVTAALAAPRSVAARVVAAPMPTTLDAEDERALADAGVRIVGRK